MWKRCHLGPKCSFIRIFTSGVFSSKSIFIVYNNILVVITDYWSVFDSLHRTKLRYGGRFPVRFNLTYFVRFTLYATFLYCNNHHLKFYLKFNHLKLNNHSFTAGYPA